MKLTWSGVAFAAALMIGAPAAHADGVLNVYNWGDYTNPDLIKKFEEKFKVKVTVTDYDSNDTALAKIRAGGHGFDMVVPSASFVPIWIEENLLLEARPDQMENFKNMEAKWADVPFDPGRKFTVPWQWGTTGILINTKYYKGDINTSEIFLNPPAELKGKINVVPEMTDILNLAIRNVGGKWCTTDKEILKKVRDKLVAAKPSWMSMDYGNQEKYAKDDIIAGVNWNGSTFRARRRNATIAYGYPKEGYGIWMDNLAILKDAKNVDNAKAFMNFVMDPENAALVSAFAGYANGIKGSDAFMPADMKDAPEIKVPEQFAALGEFQVRCPQEATDMYTAIWTELQK
jgi:spermidine/putrescine transport system substrate-binding protein